MKKTLAVCLFALLLLPGCCCHQMVCMQPCCPDPYWMEDLQYEYCQAVGSMKANMCRFRHSVNCQLCQLKTQLTACNCQSSGQSCAVTTGKIPVASHQPSCPVRQKAPAAREECHDHCDVKASKPHGHCRRCKQQSCRCGAYDFTESIAAPGPQVTQRIEQSCAVPNQYQEHYQGVPHPANSSGTVNEPVSAPPAPLTDEELKGPRKTMGPTPIPGQQAAPQSSPPANPGNPQGSSTMLPSPDPSIPLEGRANLNQVGFRKADQQRPLYNGWKPVKELPEALR